MNEATVDLNAGTRIVLTKKIKKAHVKSVFEVGQILSGTLSVDIKKDKPIYLREFDDQAVTSNVIAWYASIDRTLIMLETQKSVYSVRIVINNNDEEFKKWCIY